MGIGEGKIRIGIFGEIGVEALTSIAAGAAGFIAAIFLGGADESTAILFGIVIAIAMGATFLLSRIVRSGEIVANVMYALLALGVALLILFLVFKVVRNGG